MGRGVVNTPGAGRLLSFFLLVTLVGVVCLVRGLGSTDEPRVIYLTLSGACLASVLLFLFGWVRTSRRR